MRAPTMPLLLTLSLLTGCGMGPNEETLLDELRLVAAVAEPPEVAPGEPFTLTAWIADPQDEGAEVAVWSCLDIESCAEERADLPDDGRVIVDGVGIAPVPTWIAACAPDGCDLDARTDDDLLDPTGWLDEQPLVGTAAGFRQVRVTEAPPEERRTNPVLTASPDLEALAEVDVGEVRPLRFGVEGATSAWGLTTAGGFARPSRDIGVDGEVTLEWFAPDEATDLVDLYVVLTDEAGATTVWHTTSAVR